MIKLSEEAKKAYAKYVDPVTGLLNIDPSLPENVKEAFEFFNSEGINILELNIDDELDTDLDEDDEEFTDEELEDDEDEDEDFEDEEFEEIGEGEEIDNEDEADEDAEETETLDINAEVTEEEQNNLTDLNNMF